MINEQELLFVVNEANEPLEPKPRKEVHARGYWHRNSHVWVKSPDDQILCGQRSLKKGKHPGYWEAFFGGHVLAGASYLETAVKECNEELGIALRSEDLQFFKIFKVESGKEFVALYKLNWYGPAEGIHYEKEEVEQVKWLPLAEVKDILMVRKDPQWNSFGYEEELLGWLAA